MRTEIREWLMPRRLATHTADPDAHHTLAFVNTQVFADAVPAAWTDLDLSGVVGARECLVLLKVVKTAGAAEVVAFRKNGDADEYWGGAGGTSSITDQSNYLTVWIPTDANGIVEWRGNNLSNATVKVLAYLY